VSLSVETVSAFVVLVGSECHSNRCPQTVTR